MVFSQSSYGFLVFWLQLRYTPRTVKLRSTIIYALRWIGVVLTMEWMLHTIYGVATSLERWVDSWRGWWVMSDEICLAGNSGQELICVWCGIHVGRHPRHQYAMVDHVQFHNVANALILHGLLLAIGWYSRQKQVRGEWPLLAHTRLTSY